MFLADQVPEFFLKKTSNDFKPDEPQTAMNLDPWRHFLGMCIPSSWFGVELLSFEPVGPFAVLTSSDLKQPAVQI